jgi:SAM-dependent methyltransferase
MAAPQTPPDLPGLLLYKDVEDLEHGLPIVASYYRHPDTGIIIQHPIPEPEQLRSLYPTEYRPHANHGLVHHLKLLQARILLRKLASVLPAKDGAILDMGCGGGHLLIQLRTQGFMNLTAMDWSENLRPTMEDHGISFVSSDIESDAVLPSSYDLIILNNVIEHLSDPGKTIARLKPNLKPKGRILLITPNERSLSHRLFGRHWAGLHAPRHLHVFNPDTLTQLARAQGYSADCRLLPDPSCWAISIQNIIRVSRRPSPPYTSTAWYTLALMPSCIVPAIMEHVLSRSSSMLAILHPEKAG